MSDMTTWPWAALLLLGAAHGINPGMGWLFAVALGMQAGDRRAVWRALLPLAAGHAAAIVLAVAAALTVGTVLRGDALKWGVAATLLAAGLYRLVRHRHPSWGGMRVGTGDLAVWSLLMATAHGAGLMALPFALRASEQVPAHAGHAGHAAHGGGVAMAASLGGDQWAGATAALVHTAGYLLATAIVAVVVYERVGVRVLRRAWVNLDLLWTAALIATALLTPFI